MKLKNKFQLSLLLIGILSIGLTGWQSFEYARNAMESITFARLTSIRETKKQQIESYFRQIQNQVVTLAEDRMTIGATREFIEAFHFLHDRRDLPPHGRTQIEGDNPRAKAKYQSIFEDYANRFGYNDILIVDAQSGDIVYTVRNRSDCGANLLSSRYRGSNIARVFMEATDAHANGFARLVDFAPYEPDSLRPASFIASPVIEDTRRVGVIIFRMSIDDINRVMTSGNNWEQEGLGHTGESYIVGADENMRNDSRFFIQDPAGYFARLADLGADTGIIQQIRARKTSILLQKVHTEAALDALGGHTDTRIINDYRGIPVVSSYTPLTIPGMHWVMLAEIDASEAFAPVFALRERLILVTIVLLLFAAAVGFVISQTISRPLLSLAQDTEKFGRGDLSHRASVHTQDEIGVLACTFNQMADNMMANTDQLRKEIGERRRAEEDLSASREELRNLSTHLQSVREEERRGVAREIHDELGQALSTLKLDLSLMQDELHSAPSDVEHRISSMSEVCDATIKSVKRIITELRPRLLDDLGLTAAIEWQAGEFQQRTGIRCALTMTPEEITLDPERSTAIFRIFQETLTNIARHSAATHVTVQMRLNDDGVLLAVQDDGKGISEQQAHDPRSFGLLGIRERAHYWGGTVSITGGKGTSVTVHLPGNFIQVQS